MVALSFPEVGLDDQMDRAFNPVRRFAPITIPRPPCAERTGGRFPRNACVAKFDAHIQFRMFLSAEKVPTPAELGTKNPDRDDTC